MPQGINMEIRRRQKKRPKRVLQGLGQDYKLLKTSWSVQTKLFYEQSTLHGVRYIAENGRPFMEKFLWFSCVTIGAVTTVVIIVSLWEKFQTNPTITGLDTDYHLWKVEFPAITVCQETPSNMSRIEKYIEENLKGLSKTLGKEYFDSLTKLTLNSIQSFVANSYFDAIHSKFPDDTDLKQLVFGLMNRCEDIFERFQFKSEEQDPCENFLPVFTESGYCYTFNSRQYERKLPWSDKAIPEQDLRYILATDISLTAMFSVYRDDILMPIYILNWDEQPGIDIQPQYVWDFMVTHIKFSVQQTYTTENTRQLSVKQRHCYFADEVKLKIDSVYAYTTCTKQCRMDNAMKYCNCVPHFYPQAENYRYCKIKELVCISDHVDQIKAVDHCECELGCSNIVYEVEMMDDSDSISNKDMDISFDSWPMVRYKREVLFGWVDLLVSFGGIAGLFLGFSLLSGVEIIYYFTLRVICMLIQDKPELERIQREESSKPPMEYDLSLTPYFVSDPLPGNGIAVVARRYYRRNLLKLNNKILPLPMKKIRPQDVILSPFGIEFLN